MSTMSCPGCGANFPAAPHMAGQQVQCPNCGTPFVVPNAAQPAMIQPQMQPTPNYAPQYAPQAAQPQSKTALWIGLGAGGVFAVVLLVVVVLVMSPSGEPGNPGASGNQKITGNDPISRARLAARRTQSANNLRQVGLALLNFEDKYKHLPAAYSTDTNGKPLLSWRVHILPFLDADLYRQFKLDEPWDSPNNIALLKEMPKEFRPPNSNAAEGMTTYLGVGGPQGCFPPPRSGDGTGPNNTNIAGSTLAEMIDGTSHTIMVIEASDSSAIEWTKPVEFVPDVNEPVRGIAGMFPVGFNVLLADASIKFVSNSVKHDVLRGAYTMSGKEGTALP